MNVELEVPLTDYLEKYFGYKKFKGDQEAIINNVLAGRDSFVIMPTGGGKSMCYQLPALISPGTAIIISPLIALMKNQVDAIRNYGSEVGIAHFLNSSLNKAEITKVKEDKESLCIFSNTYELFSCIRSATFWPLLSLDFKSAPCDIKNSAILI